MRPHYLLAFSVRMIAFWRMRTLIPAAVQPFFVLLPLIGMASVPVSYLLLEKARWVLAPQLQPGRYLLFVTLFGMITGAAAAIHACSQRRYLEAGLWFFLTYLLPLIPN